MPFDNNGLLFNLFEQKVVSKEVVVLDKVYEECSYTSKGIVVQKLAFLKSKKNQVHTSELLPYPKFFNQLENNFINALIKLKLSEVEFENRKNQFLESADAKILLYGLKHKSENIIVVSEETEFSNDNKAFKKLPAICKMLDLDVKTLPEYLSTLQGINFEFK